MLPKREEGEDREGQGQSNEWVLREWKEQQEPGREEAEPGLLVSQEPGEGFEEGYGDISCGREHQKSGQDGGLELADDLLQTVPPGSCQLAAVGGGYQSR